MEHRGSHRVVADRVAVWSALHDPAIVRDSLPSCESLERTGPGEMKAVGSIEIGPVKTRFTATIRSEASDPPDGFTLAWEGRGRPAGSASGRMEISLAADGDGTVVAYRAETILGGKLAELTGRQVNPVVRAITEAFFARLAEKVEVAMAPVASHRSREVAAEPVAAVSPPEPPAVPAAPPRRFVDELDHSMGAVQLGDEPSEAVVEDKREVAANVAVAAERQIEVAAGSGLLGGPAVWGWVVLMGVVAVLGIAMLR